MSLILKKKVEKEGRNKRKSESKKERQETRMK